MKLLMQHITHNIL